MTNPQRPEDLHELFKKGVNDKDVDALMALYEPDSLTLDLAGARVEGEPALRAMLTGLVRAVDHLDGSTRKMLVHRNYALMSATFIGTQESSPAPAAR